MDVPIDVVVVSYNSEQTLARSLGWLTSAPGVTVFVVDNASSDASLATVEDLPVVALPQQDNRGFAHGCNVGWRAGSAPYVLLLNPDATLDPISLERLARVLAENDDVGLVAPRIIDADGDLEYSQRSFDRLVSTYAQAMFVHRMLPRARWADELIRNVAAYEHPGSPEWVSGACMLVRRAVLEEADGLDSGFFLYCEDKDLCRRIRAAGHDVRYEPSAICRHIGGVSAPRPQLLPVLAASRIRYAGKYENSVVVAAQRVGIALGALTHVAVSRGGLATRVGHARALRVALGGMGAVPAPLRPQPTA